jgi:hypothetical protein
MARVALYIPSKSYFNFYALNKDEKINPYPPQILFLPRDIF